MSEESLKKALGPEFMSKYNEAKGKARAMRITISDEQRAEIIKEIRNGALTPESPSFDFQGMKVMLLESPATSMQRDLGQSGAKSVQMLYVGDWVSCIFDDPEEAMKILPQENYVVVGTYREKQGTQGDRVFKNLNVRGVIPLAEISGSNPEGEGEGA